MGSRSVTVLTQASYVWVLPMETLKVVAGEVGLTNDKIAFSEHYFDDDGWCRIPLKNMSWFINTLCTKKCIMQ